MHEFVMTTLRARVSRIMSDLYKSWEETIRKQIMSFSLRDGIHCDTGAKNITRKQAGNVRAHLVEYANTHSGGMHRIVSINRHCRTLIYI